MLIVCCLTLNFSIFYNSPLSTISNAFPHIPLRDHYHFPNLVVHEAQTKASLQQLICCTHLCNQHGFMMAGGLPLLKHRHWSFLFEKPAYANGALIAHDRNIVGKWISCSETKVSLKSILLIVFLGKRFTKLQRKATTTGAKRKRNSSTFHNEYRIEFFLVDFGWPFIWYKNVATDFS